MGSTRRAVLVLFVAASPAACAKAPDAPAAAPPAASVVVAPVAPREDAGVAESSPDAGPVAESAPRAPEPRDAAGTDELGAYTYETPRVKATTPVPASVDASAFAKAGCTLSAGDMLDCAKAPGLPKDACRFAAHVLQPLGGLSPKTPIAECWTSGVAAPGLFHAGGLANAVRRFLVVDHGRVQLVGDKAAFLRRFAPVTSPAEAIAFAVAFTRGEPVFDPKPPPASFRIYAPEIEGTTVTKVAGGYRVTLFEPVVFGCGSHPTLATVVSVSTGGDVKVESAKPLYADADRHICVD